MKTAGTTFVNLATTWYGWRSARPSLTNGRVGVAVFFGKRTAGAPQSIKGEWFDVPKGIGTLKGTFEAEVRDATGGSLFSRELALRMSLVRAPIRTRSLLPDYALDFDKFSAAINQALTGRFVGYGYAIARKGAIIRTGAGGSRRLPQDGGRLSFEARTSSQAASFSKAFTAVALAQALRQRNLSFNDKIAPFLPKCWKPGPGMTAMTFADLAGHMSGLDDGQLAAKIADSNDPYKSVRGIVEVGRTKTKPSKFDYQNANCRILRYLVPAVANPDSFNQTFASKDCDKDGAAINAAVSNLFVSFQETAVLAPPLASFKLGPPTSLRVTFRSFTTSTTRIQNAPPQTPRHSCAAAPVTSRYRL